MNCVADFGKLSVKKVSGWVSEEEEEEEEEEQEQEQEDPVDWLIHSIGLWWGNSDG